MALLSLLSCGKNKSGGDDTVDTNSFYTQYLTGECGLDVISDYNSAVMKCEYVMDHSDSMECESKLTEFLNKYPGISCTAQTGYGMNERTILIDEAYIESILLKARNQ